MSTTALCINCR